MSKYIIEIKPEYEDSFKGLIILGAKNSGFIVTRIFQPHNMKEQCDGIDDDGCVYRDILMDDLEKTGRHFDIASILEEMRHD